jgi:hypothetical protein
VVVFYSRVRRTTGLRNVRPLIGVTPVRSSAAELTGMPVSPSASSPHKKKRKGREKGSLASETTKNPPNLFG